MTHLRELADARDRAELAAINAQSEARKNADITEFLVSVFAEADPDKQDGEVVTVEQVLERGVERVLTDLSEQPAEQAKLLLIMGRVQRVRGKYEQAEGLLQNALERYQRLPDQDKEDMLLVQLELARLYRQQRQFDKALPIYQALADKITDRRQTEDTRMLSVVIGLADALRGTGRLEEASTTLEPILGVLRSRSEDTLLLEDALGVHAIILRAQERLADAEAIYRELLSETFSEEDLSSRAATWNNLGFVLRQQGRFVDAQSAYEEAFRLTVEVYGEAHPAPLTVLNNLAAVENHSGQYAAMEKSLRRGLTLSRDAYGEKHWRVGVAASSLGAALGDMGRYSDALPYLEQAVEVYSDSLGPKHSWTAGASALLAAALQIEKRAERAELLRDGSLAILQLEQSLNPAVLRDIERTADWYTQHSWNKFARSFRSLLDEDAGS